MQGKPYAGNPHVRFFDEGKVALAATPRRGSLLYNGSRFMLHSVVLAIFTVFSAQSLFSKTVSFSHQPLLAGKASLTDNGFEVKRTLGTAAFAPELMMPIELVYSSSSENSGVFGYGWSSPQLESSLKWDKDGLLWRSPWGENVKFFPKKQKTPQNSIKLSPIEEAKKGRGLFAPYSDWEADSKDSDYVKSQGFVIIGKDRLKGWNFSYSNGKLSAITTPNGTVVTYEYDKDGRLQSVSSLKQKLIEIGWIDGCIAKVFINGVTTKLTYEKTIVAILPKTIEGKVTNISAKVLVSMCNAGLNPEVFSYKNSFLASATQGGRKEKFTVQSETPAERKRNLLSKDPKSKVKHTGKIAGRLIADADFRYEYPSRTSVRRINAVGDSALSDFNEQNGILKQVDFSGRVTTSYYFMRHDAAYLGKLRKVVDGRGRDITQFRYDKHTGRPVRVTDRLGNNRYLEYDNKGNCVRLTRRAGWTLNQEPVRSFAYNRSGLMTSVSELDAEGNPVRTATLKYNKSGRVVQLSDGRRTVKVGYSESGFPRSISDGFVEVRLKYDRYNRLTAAVDPNGIETIRTYADHGGIKKIERKDGAEVLSSIEIAYDLNGCPISIKDQEGRVTSCDRDALGRIVKEKYPNATEVAYDYDKIGRLTKVIDENGHEIAFGWDKFGLSSRLTAAKQLTDSKRDQNGLIVSVSSSITGKTERVVKRVYDKFDRVMKIAYAKNEIETFSYDKWGRISEHTRGDRKSTYQYDYFGRIAEKTDGENVYAYSYNPYGQRVSLTVRNDKGNVLTEKRIYDKFGRLSEIFSFGKSVKYFYDVKGRVSRQVIDGTPIDYEYTKNGFLTGKYLGGRKEPISSVVYEYSKSGKIVARSVNGKRSTYEYDGRNQLLAVKDSDGNDIERYSYDKAGNMLKKTINGRTTMFTFDGANQLVSSTVDGVTTRYTYDAAGRLVKEGNKTYRYGYLDKVMSVSDGKQKLTYDYHADGQIASANYGNGKTEEFLWDGLALVHRGGEHFINEPHVGGGNPVVSSKGVSYFNDMLGTTVGFKTNGKYSPAALSAFGENLSNHSPAPTYNSNFFTGKPYVEGLGHVFLMRNYRASLSKWQTADPMGYPDGWNQLAYCGNSTVYNVDVAGTLVTAVYSISQKTLTITDDDTYATVTVLNVISGDNNLSHQWEANSGPLPIGEYTILDHGGGHANWYELWKNDGWFNDYTTGPNGVKRGNFRLHPGSLSLGCITMPAEDVNTIAALALISKTKTETIHPASQMFSSKVKYGILSVVE